MIDSRGRSGRTDCFQDTICLWLWKGYAVPFANLRVPYFGVKVWHACDPIDETIAGHISKFSLSFFTCAMCDLVLLIFGHHWCRWKLHTSFESTIWVTLEWWIPCAVWLYRKLSRNNTKSSVFFSAFGDMFQLVSILILIARNWHERYSTTCFRYESDAVYIFSYGSIPALYMHLVSGGVRL